jgi:hypothetical protein
MATPMTMMMGLRTILMPSRSMRPKRSIPMVMGRAIRQTPMMIMMVLPMRAMPFRWMPRKHWIPMGMVLGTTPMTMMMVTA